MSKNIYDFLKRKKLHTPDNIFKTLVELSEEQLKELCVQIILSIQNNELTNVNPPSHSHFNFTASPHAIGFVGSCDHIECKVARADEFVRYAILYADTVALPNVFSQYFLLSNLNPLQLFNVINRIAGDILVLWALKPLIDAGIGVFVPVVIPLCDEHGKQLEKTWDSIEAQILRAAKTLQRKSLSNTKMEILVDKTGLFYNLHFPENLDGGIVSNVAPEKPPVWLKKTRNYKTALKTGEWIELSKQQIEKVGMVEAKIFTSLIWTRIYLFSRIYMQSKYLTSYPIEAVIFDEMISSQKLRETSRTIKESIPLHLPIFQGVDSRTLLKVRKQDYDVFSNYRARISEIETIYHKQGQGLTKADALEIYEDIIYPGLVKLKTKTNLIKKSLRTSASKKIFIATTFAVMGVSSGLLPNNLASVLSVIGGCELVNSVTDLWKSLDTPEEQKSDPFYFLWNVERYKKHKNLKT